MEHPRLGMQARLNFGLVTGSSVTPEHTSLSPAGISGNVLAEEATSQANGNLLLSYNLAPIIGVSQTFIDSDIGFSVPLAEYVLAEGEKVPLRIYHPTNLDIVKHNLKKNNFNFIYVNDNDLLMSYLI